MNKNTFSEYFGKVKTLINRDNYNQFFKCSAYLFRATHFCMCFPTPYISKLMRPPPQLLDRAESDLHQGILIERESI